ncbi:MAG TPA: DUF4232 domain-containing protein [Candidatus Saccharimonadia bacterium]|nr:DUF4232 domain-containing protein [Candidatus Saccharimonadia bacterium]
MRDSKDPNGFAKLPVLLGICLVLVVALAAYFAWSGHRATLYAPAAVASPKVKATILPPPPPSSSPARSTITTATTTMCTTSDLSASASPGSSAAGTSYDVLALANTSSKPCIIAGYPGVSLLSAAGAVLGLPATRNASQTSQQITLSPKQSAYSQIGFPDPGAFGPGKCSGAAVSMRIYPPNQTSSLSVPAAQQYCPGFSVTPLATSLQ